MTARLTNIKGSVSAGSNVFTLLEPSSDVKIGDSILHNTINIPIFVKEIKSTTKIIASDKFVDNIIAGSFTFGRDVETSKFNKFLNAYYKFLEKNNNSQEVLQNLKSYTDVDKTVDILLANFFDNYASNIPESIITDKRTFIKRVKDLYKVNGTEDSLKLIFLALFGEKIEISYPENYVLKPSDGEWKSEYSMNVTEGNGYNPFFFENTKIVGALSRASATVSSVIKINLNNENFYRLLLDGSTIKGSFIRDEPITARKLVSLSNVITVNATIIPSVIGIDIVNKGLGYTPNNLISLNSTTGNSARVKISKLSKTGSINYISVEESGIRYLPNTIVTIDNPIKTIQGSLVITAGVSSNIASFTSSESHGLSTKSTANVQINNTNLSAIVYLVVNTQEFRFRTSEPAGNYSAKLIYDNAANLVINSGAILRSEGNWISNKGKLSDGMYLRGSKSSLLEYPKYYQPFSYVVKSGYSNNEWQNLVKKISHPAGMAMFGEVTVDTDVDTSLKVDSISTEIWNYVGITCDKTNFTADVQSFGSVTLSNFPITADHTFLVLEYL